MTVEEAPHTNQRPLIALAILLGVAALVFAGLWAYGEFFSPMAAPNGEAQTAVDAYMEAWNNYDAEAFAALVTADYVFENEGGTGDAATTPSSFGYAEQGNWLAETVGEPIWHGDDPTLYMSAAHLLTADFYPEEGIEAISTMTLVKEGDSYLVARHVVFGDLP
jgi:hypothetical protein